MKKLKFGLILLLLASSADAATNRPDGYKTICKGGQTCSVEVNTKVAFGASGRFVYKVLSGSFVCNVDTFGSDPIPWKKVKECSISKSASNDAPSEDESSSDETQAPTVTLDAVGGDSKVDLAWEVSGEITSVQVMRDTDANPRGRDRVAFLNGDARSFTDQEVVNGSRYWYWIKYTYGNRVVGNSEASTATPLAVNPEPEPEPEPDHNSERLSCDVANIVQGFASIDGGTTGGAGGDSYTVSSGAELVALLKAKRKDSAPLTIYVDGTLTPDNSDGAKQFDVKDMENLSIVGIGNDALLDGIGINIVGAKNIIVRNLTIRYNRIGQKDGISIQGDSRHVWIDHNEIYNSLDVDKDYYDELVSGKNGIDNITISYNYLHDSWKTSLWGSSDSDDYERRVTFLGNHWQNANSRMPLFRFGQGHVVNNYYENVMSTAINSRMGARIRIDGNHFEYVSNPIVSFYSNTHGYWDTADNIFENVTWEENMSSGIVAGPNVGSTISYSPPYSYSLIPVDDVKQHVLNNSGVGKLEGCL
ncbi:MAG: pectate lyase [Candidatus Thiodiazotropha sp.]